MPLDLSPHKYKTSPSTGMAVLDKVVPYKLFSRREPGGRVEIFLQGGTYYWGDGTVIVDDVVRSYGLDPEFGPDGETIPTSMEEHPAMGRILEAEALESVKQMGAPVRTVIVQSTKEGD